MEELFATPIKSAEDMASPRIGAISKAALGPQPILDYYSTDWARAGLWHLERTVRTRTWETHVVAQTGNRKRVSG